jgi:NitT/TauT family transport system substrate-binding protein
MKMRIFLSLLCLLPLATPAEQGIDKLRIGVLAYGTVNWELTAMRNEGLDRKYALDLDVQTLASPEAGKIGLRADGLDMIATDWMWVANQSQSGADYRFIPYSTHAGALMAPADSKIRGVADLAGKKIGVVGGGLDKNWLLLKAYAKKQAGLDLDNAVEKVFAAPPLLNRQFANGQLDVLLNYWHYAAKQEAQGFRRVLDGRDILKGLGLPPDMPNLGYVFKRSWAESHEAALDAFLKASGEARSLLCENDDAWKKILPLTQETDGKLLAVLRKEYCAGIARRWGEAEKRAAAEIYGLLRASGGEELTGKAEKFPMEIFWPYTLP